MFDRYTERARRVVFFARYEASKSGSAIIESGHMLLGVLREDKNLVNRFFHGSRLLESIRNDIEQQSAHSSKASTSIDLPLSEDCKRILAYAAEEADRLEHRHIGTEHLLLGILREEKCIAAEILTRHGLRLEAVREELSKAKGIVSSHRLDPSPAPNLFQDDPMVPDSVTAGRIAEAIWLPVFGAETIARQRPVVANLERYRVWRVSAGLLFAFIRLKDGEVLSMGQSEGTNV